MYISLVVIPVKSEAEITCAFPIGVAEVVQFEHIEEMVNVILGDVFYAKIINHKAEPDWAPCVCPETRCEFAFAVSGNLEAFFEEFLGNKPAWGRPYIPCCTSQKILPFASTISCSLNLSIMSWGKRLIFMRKYSYLDMGVLR